MDVSFTCAFCKASYNKKSHLSKHIMGEHISKGNYSTEVKKYITGIERSTNEKECKISSQNSKECELEEKVVIVTDNVENETHREPGNAEKGEYIP